MNTQETDSDVDLRRHMENQSSHDAESVEQEQTRPQVREEKDDEVATSGSAPEPSFDSIFDQLADLERVCRIASWLQNPAQSLKSNEIVLSAPILSVIASCASAIATLP